MAILKKPEITKVIEILAEVYPEAECAVHEKISTSDYSVAFDKPTDKAFNFK